MQSGRRGFDRVCRIGSRDALDRADSLVQGSVALRVAPKAG
jgi:hypothetical protein